MTRIGTWNLAGRRQPAHVELLVAHDVDVWLLTEVSEALTLPGYSMHATQSRMAPRRRWAAVASRWPLIPLTDPHPASAAALVDGISYVSSILPWRGSGGEAPWVGDRHADRTRACLDDLLAHFPALPYVWGGDWNHALNGEEVSGSRDGRRHVLDAVTSLGLTVPTADAGRSEDRAAIDHIAVPKDVTASRVRRLDHQGLSDHDAYLLDLA